MTPDEIQALREKHRLDEFEGSCCWCYEITNDLLPVRYPCDVIKVLDAWEAEPATDSSTHAFPVGAKVRLVNNNTMGKQWGTVAQQLINGQYLVENTWLKEMYPTNPEKQEPTYQICNENQLRDIADEMTASDFEIGDKVCLWSQLHHAQSWLAVHEVVAKTPTRIVVRPTASRDQSGEILADPANWVLVPADYDGENN